MNKKALVVIAVFAVILGVAFARKSKTVSAAPTSQIQTCVWPNRCKNVTIASAQFRPCVWPNTCKA